MLVQHLEIPATPVRTTQRYSILISHWCPFYYCRYNCPRFRELCRALLLPTSLVWEPPLPFPVSAYITYVAPCMGDLFLLPYLVWKSSSLMLCFLWKLHAYCLTLLLGDYIFGAIRCMGDLVLVPWPCVLSGVLWMGDLFLVLYLVWSPASQCRVFHGSFMSNVLPYCLRIIVWVPSVIWAPCS